MLAMSVEQATQNFLEKGEQIAKDSQDLKEELIAAVEDVRKQGDSSASVTVTAIGKSAVLSLPLGSSFRFSLVVLLH